MTIEWAQNLHFDDESNIQSSSEISEESGYDLNLDSLRASPPIDLN